MVRSLLTVLVLTMLALPAHAQRYGGGGASGDAATSISQGGGSVSVDSSGEVTMTPTSTVTLASGKILFPDGTQGAPSISFSSNPNFGLYQGATDVLAFTDGFGANVWIDPRAATGGVFVDNGSPATAFGWGSTPAVCCLGPLMMREANGTMRLGAPAAGTSALLIRTDVDDTTNYEDLKLSIVSGTATIAAESGGTGAADIDINLTPLGTGVTRAQSGLYVYGDSTVDTFSSPGNMAVKNSTDAPYLSFHQDDGTRIGYIQYSSGSSGAIFTDNGGNTMLSLVSGKVGVGSIIPSLGMLHLDKGTGFGQLTLEGSSGGCIMFRDTDDAGWTEVIFLNGTITSTEDADGVCDGS